MTAIAVVVAVGLAIALAVALTGQRRVARRLLAAGARLSPEVVPTGSGLAEAASVVERGVDRVLLRDDDTSLAEARLVSALAVIPQGVVLFDRTGTIVFRNKAATAYLSARHEEALVEEVINDLASEVIDGRAMAPSRTVELFGPPARTLELRAIGLENDRAASALVVIDDVTGRRHLEAIRRDFVANISHELKTPVGALGLLAETLLAEDDAAVARRLAERMLTEAFRVARTIDDLLELSQIETDEATVHEQVALEVVLTQAVERVRGAAEQRDISIESGEPPAGVIVNGDRRQLVSATYNLLENAVKYSEPGSSVLLRARTDGRWVDIEVTDHGSGIPQRDLARVFERFYRVDRARSRETGGTGLGLAIVRHVANNHAGEVRVDSREGEGSTFTLRLPASSARPATTSEARTR